MVAGELFAFSVFGAVMLFGLLASIAGLAVMIYAFYDLLVRRERMRTDEKVLWAVAIIVFNFIGALVYLIAVWSGYSGLVKERELSELERIAELRDSDAITEEEYQELKSELVDDLKE